MNKHSYARVIAAIKAAKNIALCIHIFPDGDAIGSMTALALALKKLGKRVSLFCPSKLPHRYSFLAMSGLVRDKPVKGASFDLAIAVDCASSVQLSGLYKTVFQKAKRTVEIDHHTFRQSFADIALVDQNAAAVGEIVYGLCQGLGTAPDRKMATSLLVSIIVETGSFRLPCVHSGTFRICSDLIGLGVNYYEIVEKSYWSRTKAEAMLLGLVFSRLRFLKKGKIAVTTITFNDLKRLKAKSEDADPIADQIRTLKDVQVVLLFRQMPKRRWRVNLRSKGSVNVGRVAEEFGGGGHPDVAGCFLPQKESARRALIDSVSRLL